VPDKLPRIASKLLKMHSIPEVRQAVWQSLELGEHTDANC